MEPGPPIKRPENSVNIWNSNLLRLSSGLSSRPIIWTEPKNIYTSTSPNTLTPKIAKKSRDKCIFSEKRYLSFMSRTANSEIQNALGAIEANWAGEDKAFTGSLNLITSCEQILYTDSE